MRTAVAVSNQGAANASREAGEETDGAGTVGKKEGAQSAEGGGHDGTYKSKNADTELPAFNYCGGIRPVGSTRFPY